MASASQSRLHTAIAAVGQAFDRLEAAIDIAASDKLQSAAARESLQAELTAGWQVQIAQIEAEMTDTQAENNYLKEDNTRLSNQLQHLQQEHLELQTTASKTVAKLDSSVKQLDLILERA
jgi:predicted  nucleic acid-binding Zn-ribbon protein